MTSDTYYELLGRVARCHTAMELDALTRAIVTQFPGDPGAAEVLADIRLKRMVLP